MYCAPISKVGRLASSLAGTTIFDRVVQIELVRKAEISTAAFSAFHSLQKVSDAEHLDGQITGAIPSDRVAAVNKQDFFTEILLK